MTRLLFVIVVCYLRQRSEYTSEPIYVLPNDFALSKQFWGEGNKASSRVPNQEPFQRYQSSIPICRQWGPKADCQEHPVPCIWVLHDRKGLAQVIHWLSIEHVPNKSGIVNRKRQGQTKSVQCIPQPLSYTARTGPVHTRTIAAAYTPSLPTISGLSLRTFSVKAPPRNHRQFKVQRV